MSGPPASVSINSWLRQAADLSAPAAPEARSPLRIGTRLCGGRFVVGEVLGRGGMGEVYSVHDARRAATFALKTILDVRPEGLLAFKNEFRALHDLHHPNLVELGELFEDQGRWFFTMEKIAGVPFTRHVRPSGLDPPRLRLALLELAKGLRALHRAGKIHRDVKPSNTLVERGGRVVLLDFGLIGDARAAGLLGRPGFGTVAYMAPEQATGDEGPAADWYAAGTMLYEALTGELPWAGAPAEILARKRSERARPPSERAPGLPADLEELCVDLLHPDPRRRPDGSEIIARLRGGHAAALPARDDQPGSLAGFPGLPAKDAPRQAELRPARFVGRARELERLRAALARAERGGPVRLLIRGESGVGKTALIEAFARGLGGGRLLAGRCYEHEFIPFKALDGVIDALARHLEQLDDGALRALVPPRFAALARIFPVLGRAARRAAMDGAGGGAPPGNLPEARQQAFRALAEILSRLAEQGPLALAIDDVQWADADSLAVLEEMLRGPAPPALLLIMLTRSGTPAPLAPSGLTSLELGPLESGEATELARRLLDGPASPALEPAWLAAEAGCHPLFMEALLGHARAGDGSRGVRLDEALAARVTALGPQARALVDVVSTSAQPLTSVLAARAARLPHEAVRKLVRGLQADRLLATRRTSGQVTVEPYHDRVRGAVQGAMAAPRRSACHRGIAEALEAFAPERSEALAVHWQGAGEGERARAHAVRAARHAYEALAFDRAASFFRLALELTPGERDGDRDGQDGDSQDGDSQAVGEGESAGELHRQLAEALSSAGRGAAAAAAYRAAASCAPEAERADLERCAAEQLLRAGHIEAGLAAMDRVLAPMGMTRPRTVAGAARMLLWQKVLDACAAIGRHVAPGRPADAAELVRRHDACWAVVVGLSQFDPIASAVFQSRCLRLARRLGDPRRIALALCQRAPPEAYGGPPARRARQLLGQARALTRGRTDPFVEAYQALTEGAIGFVIGAWGEALQHCQRAAALFREHGTGVGWETATAERFVLDGLWHTGQLRELAARARQTWREAGERGDRYAAIQIETTVLPVVHLKEDDPEGARDVLAGTLAAWPPSGLSTLQWQRNQTRVLVELYAGRPAEALHIMDAQVTAVARALLSRFKVIRVFTRFLHATALLGVAVLGDGDRDAQLRRAERDVRRLEREDAAPDAVAMLRGQIHLLRGERGAAAALLGDAARLFAARGMALLGMAAVHTRGVALGGAEGEALVTEARRWMLEQGIRRPERFLRLVAPAAEAGGVVAD
jgi:hypothetical protein